jgi:hypothetical protein
MHRRTARLLVIVIASALGSPARADGSGNFTTGNSAARKFGVHEISLGGAVPASNPFDTVVTVTFVPPSGEANARTVSAFFDGDATWRARVYVHEVGPWQWASHCAVDARLDGRSGRFRATSSKLRGRLLVHPRNPVQWITEDGRWFLNLNDTAYYLFSEVDSEGQPIRFRDFTDYVKDLARHGITSARAFLMWGARGGFHGDRPERWDASVFTDPEHDHLNLEGMQRADQRLRWLLDNQPDLYLQLSLLPRGSKWKADETFWVALAPARRQRLLRHLVARYAAFPQVFWLIVNDAHYGPEYPNNNALAREVGVFLAEHDPWDHPISTGHARQVPFQFGDEAWATYLHLEDKYALDATQVEPYRRFSKPVFLGEDRYEQDTAQAAQTPVDMRAYQRRLFLAWLFAGASANYGGRWSVVHPYSQTGRRPIGPWSKSLTGLDSVRFIRDYFEKTGLSLADFAPDAALATDPDRPEPLGRPKGMRRGLDEFLVYHPNAAADGKEATVDVQRAARVTIALGGSAGRFAVEWYRPDNGAMAGGTCVMGGGSATLIAPWKGADVILRLRRAARCEVTR